MTNIKNNINKDAFFGKNVKIFQEAIIEENVEIGDNVTIYGGRLKNCKIGNDCIIENSVLEGCIIENNVSVGPFARIRPNSQIEKNCKIGNFVEIKNSTIKKETKISHLAYVGDAEIGEKCNIGCGVIFANYDGKTKHKTKVGNCCFIGSNSNIISPITIANNTYICAGTTLTHSTTPYDFVIAREKETVKHGRAKNYLKEICDD